MYHFLKNISQTQLSNGPSSVRPSIFSNISETTGPIQLKFHTKVKNDSGHMTTMAATYIYGKTPLKIFFSANADGLGIRDVGSTKFVQMTILI